MSISINPNDFVLVIGAGRSGVAAAALLVKKNINVVLYDDNPPEKLRYFHASGLTESERLSTCFAQGEPRGESYRAVVLSPGVVPTHPLVIRAQSQGLPVLNEIDVATLFMPHHRMIGITGTNGKSTTTVMIESIFRCAEKSVVACGNLGLPLCDAVNRATKNIDIVVVELSSFQLETLKLARLDGAVILNITPDHLDRYASFADYRNAKLGIRALLKPTGVFVLNENLRREINHARHETIYFNEDCPLVLPQNIIGTHNRENACAAIAVSRALGVKDEHILLGLASYQPLPHRCEVVAHKNGITFVNDSKGTTVVAVEKALSMYRAKTHLLLGGLEKGEDFSVLNKTAFPQIGDYYVYGNATNKILRDLKISDDKSYPHLHDALLSAYKNASAGDVIMLSPGCASYDQFTDYQHRGETFRKLVMAL